MDKVKIELDREFAECVHEILGCINFYMVDAIMCWRNQDLPEEDVERYSNACRRVYEAFGLALSK